MSVATKLTLDGDSLIVQRTQDVEDILENNKELAKQPNPKGEKFWHSWSLPNVEVEKFYIRYCAGKTETPPMNEEFWGWVDKQIKTDPDYKHFRTNNPSNPFFIGYR